MTKHPSYGPYTPEQFQALMAMPHGQGVAKVREVDEKFGRGKMMRVIVAPGQRWTCRRNGMVVEILAVDERAGTARVTTLDLGKARKPVSSLPLTRFRNFSDSGWHRETEE